MKRNKTRGLARLSIGACLLLAVAACGSSDASNERGAGGSGSGGAGIKSAEQIVDQYTAEQPFELTALPEAPPQDITVASVNCTLPSCNPGQIDAPVAALGWTLEDYPFDLAKGPEDFIAQMTKAVAAKPDYIAMTAVLPLDLVADQLAQAKAEGIKVVAVGASEKTGWDYCLRCPASNLTAFSLTADIALADAGEKVDAGIVVDPNYAVLTTAADSIEAEFEKNGEGSTVDRVEVSVTDPPQTITANIIGFLQRKPDVNYLIFTQPDLLTGFDGALKAAGLDNRVKLISAFAANEANVNEVKSGNVLAMVAVNLPTFWLAVDAMARWSVGADVGDTAPIEWRRIMTQKTASMDVLSPPDYESIYLSAWQVS